MATAAEEVYDPFTKWKYDTNDYNVSSLGRKVWCQNIWGSASGSTFSTWATTYTGHYKTLDVKVGQRFKVKAAASSSTQILFCNVKSFSTRQSVKPVVFYNIPAGQERTFTVPAGFDYMKIYFCNNGSIVYWPERIARLVAYG